MVIVGIDPGDDLMRGERGTEIVSDAIRRLPCDPDQRAVDVELHAIHTGRRGGHLDRQNADCL